jgi:hypothetical protein
MSALPMMETARCRELAHELRNDQPLLFNQLFLKKSYSGH